MAESKTKPTSASVADYLEGIDDTARRQDCETLIAIMHRVTGEKPVMWGTSIVGFGRYRYRYQSGGEGESCVTGFSSRKGDISVYLVAEGEGQAERLTRLGKHRMAKACLRIRRLSEVDPGVLEELVAASVAEVRRRYPAAG